MTDYKIQIIFLGALVSGLIAIQIHRINAFRTASIKFSNIILNELKDIYPIPSNWPDKIDYFLRYKFPTLQAAVSEFREHLPWYKRRSFDRAWIIYRYGYDGDKDSHQDYWQYQCHKSTFSNNGIERTIDTSKTYKSDLKKNVDRLLKYAKKT